MKTTIYTDGSCVPNPGIGGWGVVLLYDDKEIQLYGGDDDTTNNRMELLAIIKGIEKSIELGANEIEVVSDSQYCVNTINDWMAWWALNDFYKDGEKRLNHDLIEQIFAYSNTVKINAKWVRGHSGNKYNEIADELSNRYRGEAPVKKKKIITVNRYKHSTQEEKSKDMDMGLFYRKILERAVGCTAFNRRNFSSENGASNMIIFAEFNGYKIARNYFGCELWNFSTLYVDQITDESEIVFYREPLMARIDVYVKYI